jgi:hypothetical protein
MKPELDEKPRLILAYLVSARGLSKCWFCRLHRVYVYGSDLLALVAGLGISQPVTSFASSISKGTALPSSLLAHTGPWFWFGVTLAVAWGVLRIVMHHENVEKRAVLALGCHEKFHRFDVQFAQMVPKPDSIDDMNEMYASIIAIHGQAREIWAWPWQGFRPSAEAEANKEWETLYKNSFKPAVPSTTRQQRPPKK